MRPNRTPRVVKRGQKMTNESTAAMANTAGEGRDASSEREMKQVVTDWVREHRRIAEELRRASFLALARAR